MPRNKLDKFLIVDTDSAIYACCFITVKKEHFAAINGKMVFATKNKNKYNKWYKAQSPEDQVCIDYSFTEEQLPFMEAKKAMDGWLHTLGKLAGCDRRVLMLTKGGNCFRTHRALIKKYKGNRDNLVKPPYYDELREYLINDLKAPVYHKWEADDTACMSMEKCRNKKGTIAILAAIDKDLEQQEGRHINPNKKDEGVYVVSKLMGLKSFYKQMLMGDVADNIPGLPGVGAKSPLLKKLEECETELECFELVWKAYKTKFGDWLLVTPWWWDAKKLMKLEDDTEVSKYFSKEYFDYALAAAKRKMYPDKEIEMTVEEVFYENADLLYMLRSPKDQYVAPCGKNNQLGFKVREPYAKGIVIEMLGEDSE